MASIQRIVSPLTRDVAYRAQVRVKGRPAQSQTFPNRKEAQSWAAWIETAIREGRHLPHAAARRTSFDARAKNYSLLSKVPLEPLGASPGGRDAARGNPFGRNHSLLA
jgi:hypothetical protein